MLKLRSPIMFSGAFLLMALLYAAFFNYSIRSNAETAKDRFYALMDLGAPRAAAAHGERAITLSISEGAEADAIAALKVDVAESQFARKRYSRSADLLQDALVASWGRNLKSADHIAIEDRLARAHMHAGNVEQAAAIYASFLELAGDAAASHDHHGGFENTAVKIYARRLAESNSAFLRVVNYAQPAEIAGPTPEHILATASHMAALGGYFAMRAGDEYAAAGLLATAYEARKKVLGGDHQDTVQLTLILGPLYTKMGRLKDAEALYLDAFHAQERAKGANSPDLSLYIKLLAGIYEAQERYTEAQALYEHMRGLFRDAFGAQRYAVNREFNRREYINRPVSQYFPLEEDYAPSDLVSAAEFFVPTAKGPNIDEMKLRAATDKDGDAREDNLPARLAQLISLCRSESGEAVSLRSGYRSYKTQAVLHQRNGDKGTVTPPGVSEHQTGLAADINVNGRFMRQSDRTFQCFEENAFRFGFILSYPPGNDYLPGEDTFEPWHWRYVGVQTAQLYREAGPHNQPQEFLAALPCYQERAASGIFPTAGEKDVCLAESPTRVAQAKPEAEEKKLPSASARILNSQSKAIADQR
ncbi:MAG: D-alanyl-D-alanine carboxypeptidase family protein [Pseudomonadota bacterium]